MLHPRTSLLGAPIVCLAACATPPPSPAPADPAVAARAREFIAGHEARLRPLEKAMALA